MTNEERARILARILAECNGVYTICHVANVAYRLGYSITEIGSANFLRAVDWARDAQIAAEQRRIAA